MKRTEAIMGMPITIEVVDGLSPKILDEAFDYFRYVDEKFSTYKENSEITKINRGEIPEAEWSQDMREIMSLGESARIRTDGYFNVRKPDGSLDPSGVVKGWAIEKAAKILLENGAENFFVEAGGDIEVHGLNGTGQNWTVGIKNPFNQKEIVKTLSLRNGTVATSGSYIRGQHIYNPHSPGDSLQDIVSITVIGPNICWSDIYATAAFAMGINGIQFIEGISDFEAYMIDARGIATYTSGLDKFLNKNA